MFKKGELAFKSFKTRTSEHKSFWIPLPNTKGKTTIEVMDEYFSLQGTEKIDVLWDALVVGANHRKFTPQQCVCVAMGYNQKDDKWIKGSKWLV